MIVSRYASSLYNISLKRGIVQEVSKDLEILNSLLKNEKFKILIESPILLEKEKKSILDKIDFSNDFIIDFTLFLLSKGDFFHFSKIVNAFYQLKRKKENILKVKVYTPKALTQKLKEDLIQLLETKLKNKIELKEFLNKNLLGGIKIEFKDKVIDATYKNYLDNIRRISTL